MPALDPLGTSVHITLSNSNQTATRDTVSPPTYANTVSFQNVGTKLYVEATYPSSVRDCGIGICNDFAALADADHPDNWLGFDNNSIAQYNGDIVINFAVVGTRTAPAANDILGFAIDTVGDTMSFRNVTQGEPWSTPVSIAALGSGSLYFGFTMEPVAFALTLNFDNAFAGLAPPGYTRWNGTAAPNAVAYTMAAGTGTAQLAGQPVATRFARKLLVPTPGVVAINGQAAGVRFAHRMPSAVGTLTLGGQVNTLRATRQLPVPASGALNLSGKPAALWLTRNLPVTTAPLTLSGRVTNLRGIRTLPIGTGTLVLSGQPAALTKAAHFVMPATPAALILSGPTINLPRAIRAVTADTGNVIFLRQWVELLYTPRPPPLIKVSPPDRDYYWVDDKPRRQPMKWT